MNRDNESLLYRAVVTLSNSCDHATSHDSVGFNAADSNFGNSIARKPYSQWSQRMREAAYDMVQKYRKQLGTHGINVSDIPEPQPEVNYDQKLLVSKTPGKCSVCQGNIKPGGTFIWGASRGERVCQNCIKANAGFSDTPVLEQVVSQPEAPVPQVGKLTVDQLLGPGGVIAESLPGYEPRQQQLRGAALFHQSMINGGKAVAELGTGTGKSLAAMIPASETGRRTIISTSSKALQMQYSEKDAPFLERVLPDEIKPTVAVLKGRRNYICLKMVDDIKSGFGGEMAFPSKRAAESWNDVLAWVSETDTGDLETAPFQVPPDLWSEITVDSDGCLGDKCPFYSECWTERAKAKAGQANLVIVNHHLMLTDAMLADKTDDNVRVLPVIPSESTLVIDEAHNLEDIATSVFGDELRESRWGRIERRLIKLTVGHPAVQEGTDDYTRASNWVLKAQAVTALYDKFLEGIKVRLEQAGKMSMRLGDESVLSDELVVRMNFLRSEMTGGTPSWLTGDQRESWRKLEKMVESTSDTIQAVSTPGNDDFVIRYAEIENGRIILYVKPIEVADILRDAVFDKYRSVVSMSATIATGNDISYWCDRVGCTNPLTYVADSPFDYRHNALLYLPQDGKSFDPTWGKQGTSYQYVESLASEIQNLLLASNGRAFVLFTSNKMLNEIYNMIAHRLRWTVLKQGDLPNRELVARFKDDGNAVLFGTKSFWEGVDVQGDALSMVIIDKLPFAPPDDPVWAAKCDAYNRRHGDAWAWWHGLAIPNAIIQMKQGFGRLIRTGQDRGVVAILDGRLTTKGYGKRIIESLPPARVTRSLEEVRAFFS